jgi:succinylglutamate desuccinylase
MGSKVSESAELRFMLYEALLLLTRTQVGRTLLRNAKVYPVLREVHKFENSFQIPIDEHIEALEIIVEQTVLLDEPDVD